jgi:uncharacterized protein (DUF488 family)
LHLDQKGDLLCSRLYELKTLFCLLCAEKYASTYHRKVISDYLVDKGDEVEHLE